MPFQDYLTALRRLYKEDPADPRQSPLTTALAQPDIYKLPPVVRRGITILGGERPELTNFPLVTKRMDPGTHMNTLTSGIIQINPESSGVQGTFGEEDVADALTHELEHRKQDVAAGPWGRYGARIRENIGQLTGRQPYGTGPRESAAFQAQAKRAARRGVYSQYAPADIMQQAMEGLRQAAKR